MENSNILKILFFGDLVGKVARIAVTNYLQELKKDSSFPDFIIANVENASHGLASQKRIIKNYPTVVWIV